jgi:phage baseplate assembly protein W
MTSPVAMRIPFELSSDGSIAVETDPDRQIHQRVRALVGTSPGQRVMNVNIGIDLAGLLFEPDDSLVEGELLHSVTTLLAMYEPGVNVLGIRPVIGKSSYGVSSLEVDYNRTESPSTSTRLAQNVNTALINIGGQVSEVIRG